jgi:hypothetical protein
MKLQPELTTVVIHREDLAIIRYWAADLTDYRKLHTLVEQAVPLEVKNKARLLYKQGKIE